MSGFIFPAISRCIGLDWRRQVCVLPVCWLMVIAAGCGSGTTVELAPVHGTVTYQGKPLQQGRVVFQPDSSTPGPPATAAIQPDGSYVLTTIGRDGAPVGKHVVTVHCRREITREEATANSQVLQVGESLIPIKYSNVAQTPFHFEVREGSNEFDISLD